MYKNIDKNTSYKNIKWGTILTYVILIISLLNGLLLTPLILKHAGTSNYGFYSFALSITTWLPVLTNALTASFIKFATIDEKNNNSSKNVTSIYFKLISRFCIFGLIAFVVTLLILFFSNVKLGQYNIDENNLIYLLLLISSINSFSSIFFSLFTLFANYKERFIFVEAIKLFTALFAFLLKTILIILTKKIEVLVIIDFILTIVFGGITFFYTKFKLLIPIDLRVKLKENKVLIKEIILFSSFLLLNNLAEQINNHLDITILGIFADSSSVATYQLSFTFCSYLSSIPVAIATLFIPKINEYYANEQFDKINSLFLKVSHLQCLFVLLILGGYLSCGKEFIEIWLGGPRDDVFFYSVPLLIIHSMPLTTNIAIEVQRAYNKHQFRAISLLIIALANGLTSAICVLLLPKQYAVIACVICTVLSKFVGVWVLFNVYNYKVIKLPIPQYLKETMLLIIKTSLCVFSSLAINSFLTNINCTPVLTFLITGFLFVGAYFLLVLLPDKAFFQILRRRK